MGDVSGGLYRNSKPELRENNNVSRYFFMITNEVWDMGRCTLHCTGCTRIVLLSFGIMNHAKYNMKVHLLTCCTFSSAKISLTASSYCSGNCTKY